MRRLRDGWVIKSICCSGRRTSLDWAPMFSRAWSQHWGFLVGSLAKYTGSRAREKPCLRRIRLRVKEDSTQCPPLPSAYKQAVHHTHVHTCHKHICHAHMFAHTYTHTQITEGSQVWCYIIPTVRRLGQEDTVQASLGCRVSFRDQCLHENLSTIIPNNSKKAKREWQELLHWRWPRTDRLLVWYKLCLHPSWTNQFERLQKYTFEISKEEWTHTSVR